MDGIIMSGLTAQILIAMIALLDQHGMSGNDVLLHSTRGCGKKNGAN